jgi:ketosteroid isomerase-like protein
MAYQVGPLDPEQHTEQQLRNARLRGAGAEASAKGQANESLGRGNSELRWPKPSQAAIAAAVEAMQRVGLEADSENMVNTTVKPEASNRVCAGCGAQNREANKFCGLCGAPLLEKKPIPSAAAEPARVEQIAPSSAASNGDHHYYHHYHHHFFATATESGYPESNFAPRVPVPDHAAKELIPNRAPLNAPAISRAEAAVRKQTQALALACNSKQLDDLVDVYAPDALLLRPNTPPVRGSAAIREHFFGLLESGLGEVELEPLRVEIVGEMAYEAGRCKMLVPFAMGKRREERGKYLMVYNRRSSGEWKIVVDCWSNDLSLSVVSEPEPLKNALPPRPGLPRKSA